jgi:hypothetical protein
MKTLFYNASIRKTVFNPFDRTKLLAETATVVNEYFVAFRENHVAITVDQFAKLSTILFKLKSAKNTNFERIRLTLVSALQLLMAAIDNYAKYKNVTEILKRVAEKASILDSIESILEYLKMVNASPFPDATITVIAAQIRPEYALYIKRYGKPVNGLFDAVLLSNIIAELA